MATYNEQPKGNERSKQQDQDHMRDDDKKRNKEQQGKDNLSFGRSQNKPTGQQKHQSDRDIGNEDDDKDIGRKNRP